MKFFNRITAFMVAVAVLAGAALISASAADSNKTKTGAAGITIHYYCEGAAPSIYYWNSLPSNLETEYPGPQMQSDSTGANWYKYTFAGKTKINFIFVQNGVQSDELTRNTGEWWYKNSRWYSKDPAETDDYERSDLREDSIYFVITTRFNDGDSDNNVHCWADDEANNPDTDTAWRGDFKGLIEKLDYIKALGFSAIWITPVVENASGYDYHGYHAFDFSKVDPRYESSGATYQDLIDAAHEKGIKIIQDVVWNHTGNFGEATLCPMFEKKYSNIKELGDPSSMKVIEGSELDVSYPNYANLDDDSKYQARLDIMQSIHNEGHDTNEAFHRETSGCGWGQPLEQYASIEGDCRDVNTENPEVAKFLTDTYLGYADMGVDAFRLDTEKHINRWTLNSAYFPRFTSIPNFFIFGEVCARWREFINEGGASDSPFFYTWKETDSKWTNNWKTTFLDWNTNFENSKKHYEQYSTRTGLLTSNNVYLNGIRYRTPDYSKSNKTGVIDFTMHWSFENAHSAYSTAIGEDPYFNDSTYNVTYVDSHDYGPDGQEKVRYNAGTQAWAENLDLIFTFRGIPCIFYGSEIEFQKGQTIDPGTKAPLSTTGRAYFGDNITGSVTASDFGIYRAEGNAQNTLSKPLAAHVRKLNMIRRAVVALQKGQYTKDGNYVSGDMAYIRRYTDSSKGIDSLALVTISGGATFKNIPNGKYIDAVTGDIKEVSNGTLSVGGLGTANMRVYVCCADGFTGINGKIGDTGTYLK